MMVISDHVDLDRPYKLTEQKFAKPALGWI